MGALPAFVHGPSPGLPPAPPQESRPDGWWRLLNSNAQVVNEPKMDSYKADPWETDEQGFFFSVYPLDRTWFFLEINLVLRQMLG